MIFKSKIRGIAAIYLLAVGLCINIFALCETNFFYAGMPKIVWAASTDDYIVLTNCGYIVGYSEQRKVPLWCAYHLRKIGEPGEKVKNLPKRPPRFLTDTRTRSKVRHDDYTNTGYDRGHMAPNYAIASRYGETAQNETFYMSNICPQTKTLNQQTWKYLEEIEADYLANKYDEIWILTGPIFSTNSTNTIGPARVHLPEKFFKIIVDIDKDKPRALAFVISQDSPPTYSLEQFLTTIAQIEEATGIDFFSELPDELEAKLEHYKAKKIWEYDKNK